MTKQAGDQVTERQAQTQTLAGDYAQALLCALATWGNTTTIILHGGCVFEFKGPFPKGAVAEGFYNLEGPVPGFHGHIRLDAIHHIGFQDRQHRGRQSYAFTFQDQNDHTIFKVFLGRDDQGDLIPSQVEAFKRIRHTLSI